MGTSPLTQQGIEAYRAGNKEEAIRLLSDAVRQNPQDEDAWLYLGAAIDDPARKRQAFQRVLAINPASEKAKNALARLDAAAGPAGTAGATTGSASGASAGGASRDAAARMGNAANVAGERLKSAWAGKEGFAVPGNIPGAPPTITVPEIIANARVRAQQGMEIYQKQDFEQVVAAGATATMWDSVFLAAVGVVLMGAANLFGRFIGWFLGGFVLGPGALIFSPIFGAVVAIAATAAGFAGAVYASRYYLQNQNVNVPMPQHSMYFASVWFPMILINAALTFFLHAIPPLALCLSPILLVAGLVLVIYNGYILWKAFERVYGEDNNRGLFTAIIAVLGGAAASVIVSMILGVIFRVG